MLEGIIKELSVYLRALISAPFHIKIEFPISQLEQDSHLNQSFWKEALILLICMKMKGVRNTKDLIS